MTIRPARLEDCAAIAAIYQQSIDARDCTMGDEARAEDYRRFLGSLGERQVLLVLERAGVVLGWGRLKQYSDRPGYRVACETSIFLHRAHLGQGHGRPLQEALLEQARTLRYRHVVARIWASNASSIRFHEQFGFRLVGVQEDVGYVAGQWRDVAIYQLVLKDVEPFQPDRL